MEEQVFSFKMKVYNGQEIPEEYISLVNTAVAFKQIAYAPYSNFLVGAAVLTEAGNIVGGANQENASYPLCMCGERVALYHCAMAHPSEKVVAVAISVKSPSTEVLSPVMPCGACRQVIQEYENRFGSSIKIIIVTDDEKVWIIDTIKDILPLGFDERFL
ncbi:MAG TPA: cytidine deaminase [Saprospiraceae bacterium]|nr:cytidine deaminase [Saprospiraceae bacterium]